MFLKREKDGVIFYISDILYFPHAFSTRIGGVSALSHTASMNFAREKGDSDDTVAENYRILERVSGVRGARIKTSQIHSKRVVYTECAADLGECDGAVTDKENVILSVKSADCLPILFEDADAGVIGSAHAGWRGSAMGIACECIRLMEKRGAEAKNIKVAIGPSVHPCCYEVKEDFRLALCDLLGSEGNKYVSERDGRLFADLQKINKDILISLGVKEENIDISELCTACDTKTFYSHRVMGNKRGVMCALISM